MTTSWRLIWLYVWQFSDAEQKREIQKEQSDEAKDAVSEEEYNMELWERFGIGEGLTDLWQELGISAGTAIIVLIALYFVIKWAVKNGMMEAYKKIEVTIWEET